MDGISLVQVVALPAKHEDGGDEARRRARPRTL